MNIKQRLQNKYKKIIEIVKKLEFENTYLYENDKKQKEIIFIEKNEIQKYNFYNLLVELNNDKEFRQILNEYDYKNFINLYNDLINLYYENESNKKVIKNIVYKLDFKQTEKIKIYIIGDNLIITKNNIEFYFDNDIKIDKEKLDNYLKMYLKVFPDFVEFLDIVVYNLFDKGRKRSFVYINSPSDWGKSFLIDIFNELKIGIQTQLDKLTKIPSPLSPEHFENKILLSIDEFTIFKKELKELTNKFTLEPKNKSQVDIQLFTKLFTSAEMSVSFDEVVDTQILNRIIFYDYVENKTLKVEDLKKQYNIDLNELHTYLRYFTRKYIKDKIDYIKQNDINVVEEIDKIFEKRRIQVDNIESKLIEMLVDYYEKFKEENDIKDFQDYGKRIVIDDTNKKMYITSFVKFLENYVEDITDKQTFKKLQYKFKKKSLQGIFNFYEIRESINGRQDRFYVINVEELKNKYKLIKSEKDNINILSEKDILIEKLQEENLQLKRKLVDIENLLNQERQEKERKINFLENIVDTLKFYQKEYEKIKEKYPEIINKLEEQRNNEEIEEIPF